jgi:NADH-quinone oxidoreductase subunit C
MAGEFEKGLGGLEAGPGRTGSDDPVRAFEATESHPSVDALRRQFGDAVLHHELHAGDEHVVFIRADRNVEILRWLRDDPEHRYDLLADLTAVDYGGGRPLQVVYQLWSVNRKR